MDHIRLTVNSQLKIGKKAAERHRRANVGSGQSGTNGMQLAGTGKPSAGGTVRVNGNDITVLIEAFDSVPADDDRPAVVICDTRIGSGVPFLETREKAHFMRIDENEWAVARQALHDAAATASEGN